MASEKALMIAHWATRIVGAGILNMGAIPKLTGGAGALADKLPGGNAAVMAIAVAELAAIVLILVPRTTLVGSLLAMGIMFGAIMSHVAGPVGMEGDFASMFAMAIVAFVSASAASVIAFKRGWRLFGHPGGVAQAAAS